MDRCSAGPGRRVSVDRAWYERDPKPKWPPYLLEREVPSMQIVEGEIHDPATWQKVFDVGSIMNAWPFDLLFIDADHSYEGTQKHWEMYSPLVRPGGYVGFHDTANGWACGKFFRDMTATYSKVPRPHWEFKSPKDAMGIGFIQI